MVNAQGAKLTGYLGPAATSWPARRCRSRSTPPTWRRSPPPRSTPRSTSILGRKEPVKTVPFDAADPTSYNKQTPIDVYDSAGQRRT
jgi:flagellar hook protein FlgE